jgi:hypothetical protein
MPVVLLPANRTAVALSLNSWTKKKKKKLPSVLTMEECLQIFRVSRQPKT